MAVPRWLKCSIVVSLGCWLSLATQAHAGGDAVPLQCRIDQGDWRSCRMLVEQVGRHWYLELDSRRIEFRHKGDGRIQMLRTDSSWQQVDSRWEEGSLCWGQVCARGEIPLD